MNYDLSGETLETALAKLAAIGDVIGAEIRRDGRPILGGNTPAKVLWVHLLLSGAADGDGVLQPTDEMVSATRIGKRTIADVLADLEGAGRIERRPEGFRRRTRAVLP